jgi:hypothetical protein
MKVDRVVAATYWGFGSRATKLAASSVLPEPV